MSVTQTTEPEASIIHLLLAEMLHKPATPMVFPWDQMVKRERLLSPAQFAALGFWRSSHPSARMLREIAGQATSSTVLLSE